MSASLRQVKVKVKVNDGVNVYVAVDVKVGVDVDDQVDDHGATAERAAGGAHLRAMRVIVCTAAPRLWLMCSGARVGCTMLAHVRADGIR